MAAALTPVLRWIFHATKTLTWEGDRYRAPSLDTEGFLHGSFRDRAVESAKLYDAGEIVLAIDPRRLDVRVDVADTPRGPMPHIHGSVPRDAVTVMGLSDVAKHDDQVRGTRFAFCSFRGMTLLDLVGPLDAISRIASMGFDDTTTCEVISLTEPAWEGWGTSFGGRLRPPLDEFDVLVVPGGPGAVLLKDELVPYLATFPKNRLLASVCTGSLLIADRLKGKRATTHASARATLASLGVEVVTDRVVDEGQIVTSGGVTSGIDLGLHLVARIAGPDFARTIRERMEY